MEKLESLKGKEMKEVLTIIKIGGNIVDDENRLLTFLNDFSKIKGKKILVHGGGKLATKLADQLKIPQQMVDGRRITDAETLRIVTMVYAGLINKNIVAGLHKLGCNAFGFCGADGNAILAHKRTQKIKGAEDVDFGFAGDIDLVNADLFRTILNQELSPVIAPITHDGNGQLLNTNADTIAQEIGKALSPLFQVNLVYSFEKSGVLLDANDEETVLRKINPEIYKELKAKNQVFAGMIPKLDNAFEALHSGVNKVIIGKAEEIHQLLNGEKGTSIINV